MAVKLLVLHLTLSWAFRSTVQSARDNIANTLIADLMIEVRGKAHLGLKHLSADNSTDRLSADNFTVGALSSISEAARDTLPTLLTSEHKAHRIAVQQGPTSILSVKQGTDWKKLWNKVWPIVKVSLVSVGVAFVMGGIGYYLSVTKVITKEVKKGMSELVMKALLPCLLFTSIIECDQCGVAGKPVAEVPACDPCMSIKDKLNEAAVVFVFPIVNMMIGLIVGYLMTRLMRVQKDFSGGAIAAISFGNATAMPLTVLSVVHSSMKASGIDHIAEPLQYHATYLVLYPILQFTVGAWLFGVGEPPLEHENVAAPSVPAIVGEATPDQAPAAKSASFGTEASMASAQSMGMAATMSTLMGGSLSVKDHQRLSRCIFSLDDAGVIEEDTDLLSPCHEIDEVPNPVRGVKRRAVLDAVITFFSAMNQPPIVAILLGLLIGATPVRGWIVDIHYQCWDAPMMWVYRGLRRVGQAAVPVNMLVLGASLADSGGLFVIPLHTNMAIVLSKMVLVPGCAFALVSFLKQHLILHLALPVRNAVWLVVLTSSIFPTANNINILAQLGNQNKGALACTIFLQYIFAPVLVSIWMTVFLDSLSGDIVAPSAMLPL